MVVGGEGGGGVLEGKGMGGGQLLELFNMFSAYMARINFRKHTLFHLFNQRFWAQLVKALLA